MRTISIQADGEHLDRIMEEWLAHLVLTIPVGPHGIKFDGDLSNGTIVNHRAEGQWTVSFRPSPSGSRTSAYSNPYAVARVIISHEHETAANLPVLMLPRQSCATPWEPGCREACAACSEMPTPKVPKVGTPPSGSRSDTRPSPLPRPRPHGRAIDGNNPNN